MTTEQQINLIRYGEEIGILVTPIEQCDVKGVAIGKLEGCLTVVENRNKGKC